jgi:hypothetical protein
LLSLAGAHTTESLTALFGEINAVTIVEQKLAQLITLPSQHFQSLLSDVRRSQLESLIDSASSSSSPRLLASVHTVMLQSLARILSALSRHDAVAAGASAPLCLELSSPFNPSSSSRQAHIGGPADFDLLFGDVPLMLARAQCLTLFGPALVTRAVAASWAALFKALVSRVLLSGSDTMPVLVALWGVQCRLMHFLFPAECDDAGMVLGISVSKHICNL